MLVSMSSMMLTEEDDASVSGREGELPAVRRGFPVGGKVLPLRGQIVSPQIT